MYIKRTCQFRTLFICPEDSDGQWFLAKFWIFLLVDSKFTLSFNVAFSNEFQQKENEDHSCILIRDPYFENMNIMNSLHDDNLIENVAETIWSNSYDKVEGESVVGGESAVGGEG